MQNGNRQLSEHLKAVAKTSIRLLDLTNLNDDCCKQDIDVLCANAQTKYGNAAAICIWPRFVAYAKPQLVKSNIKIATVVNFPSGGANTNNVVLETRDAIASGADEIDLVFPYEAFLSGDVETAAEQIATIKSICGSNTVLKVIIETGELKLDDAIKSASHLAIDNGADFIKTSTGKVDVNATLHSAGIMLQAISDSKKTNGKVIGFKPAGGLKTTQDAADYLALVEKTLGKNWVSPNTLRFGASSILTNLLATLNDDCEQVMSHY